MNADPQVHCLAPPSAARVPIHDWAGLEQLRRRLRLDPYRLRRFRHALYVKSLELEECLQEIPAPLREVFRDNIDGQVLTLLERRRSSDGAEKLLLQTSSGRRLETVVMQSRYGRRSVCISSQVGCAAGCAFCATGYLGPGGNLTASEMVQQVVIANRLLREQNQRIRNLVFMGMGEPFHNEAHVADALRVLHHREGLGMSQRRTVVSTVGLPRAMIRHALAFRRAPLAVSLHSAIQQQRELLIPVARSCPLPELAEAMWRVVELQRQPIMIEYIMLRGVNDRPQDLEALLRLCRGRDVLINLIPYNPIAAAPLYQATPRTQLRAFGDALRDAGLTVTIRNSQGGEVSAACGQLAAADQQPQ